MVKPNSDAKKEAQVKDLFKLGAHFGYSRSRRHPSTSPYIFGFKNRTAIIDLEKTVDSLDAAKAFVYDLGTRGKRILFVGTKNEAVSAVKNAAELIDAPYVNSRWLGGTLTNGTQMKKRIARLNDLTSKKEKGELSVYTKKERLMIDKEIIDLDHSFGRLGDLRELPAVMVVIDPAKEAIAVAEAKKMKVPVLALANSDCDLRTVNYPVVANDASKETISYFLLQIAAAYQDGKAHPVAAPVAPVATPAEAPVL